MEVQPFGIDVIVIEPGGIKTEWAGIAAEKLRQTSGHGPYAQQTNAMAKTMVGEASRKRQSSPQIIADTIAKAVTSAKPKTRYAIGFAAKPLLFMRSILSDRAFDGMIRMATGIPKPSKAQ
jgi:NAD(P)-dependent dehydrogenase (short-subunit alcohol dehydrogenase family)